MEESPQADVQLIQPGCEPAARSEQWDQFGALPQARIHKSLQGRIARVLWTDAAVGRIPGHRSNVPIHRVKPHLLSGE